VCSSDLYVFNAIGKSYFDILTFMPHQSYYIASQSRIDDRPSALSNVIISRGAFAGNPLYETCLNEQGIFYSAADASRSSGISCKFMSPSDDKFYGRYGIIVNYYQESTYDVASRLGIDQGAVVDDMMQDYGIVAIYSKYEVGGSTPGVGLYYWADNDLVLLGTYPIVLPENTWHWLKMNFIDGQLRMWYRLDGEQDWTLIFGGVYNAAIMPWNQDTFGRGAVFLENSTPHVDTYPFFSGDQVIPVASLYGMVAGEYYKVDDEIIHVSSLSIDITPSVTLTHDTEHAFRSSTFVVPAGSFGISLGTADSLHSDNYYVGCALVVSGADGTAGKAFRITGYDAIAPDDWSPVGSYAFPDTWQDHVGDARYGSWVQSNKRIVYVSEDPSGVIADGCTARITPALIIDERGATDPGDPTCTSEPTTHDASFASIYRAKAVVSDWVDGFTGDPDWTIEDVIRYAVEGAGGAVSFGALQDGNVTTSGTWGASNWFDGMRSFSADITIPSLSSGDEVGCAFRMPTAPVSSGSSGPTTSSGYMVTVQRDDDGYWAVLRMCVGGVWSIPERQPIDFVPSGTLRVSCQDSNFGLWINRKLVGNFYEATNVLGDFMSFVSRTAKTFYCHLSEIPDFISMWAIDASSNALSVVGSLIQDRRIYFSENADGSLYFYRYRRDAGSMPDIGLALTDTTGADVVPWTRTQGIKFVEDADASLLYQYGMSYNLLVARWANSVDDTMRYGKWFRADQAARVNDIGVSILPYPKYQVGDSIVVTYPDSSTKRIDIIGTSLNIQASMNQIEVTEDLSCIGHVSIVS
jgi:hypothetical protein